MNTKVCTRCHKRLLKSKYYIIKINSKNYHKSECKLCSNMLLKKWKVKNKKHIKDYINKYNLKEKVKIKNRKRSKFFRNKKENKIGIKNYQKHYRIKNKNKLKLYNINYKILNKEKIKKKRHKRYLKNKKQILQKHKIYARTTGIYYWRSTTKYEKWRSNVYKKANYTCQKCKRQNCKLNAHHIKPAKQYPKLRYNVNNGICVCEVCHKHIHYS